MTRAAVDPDELTAEALEHAPDAAAVAEFTRTTTKRLGTIKVGGRRPAKRSGRLKVGGETGPAGQTESTHELIRHVLVHPNQYSRVQLAE